MKLYYCNIGEYKLESVAVYIEDIVMDLLVCELSKGEENSTKSIVITKADSKMLLIMAKSHKDAMNACIDHSRGTVKTFDISEIIRPMKFILMEEFNHFKSMIPKEFCTC